MALYIDGLRQQQNDFNNFFVYINEVLVNGQYKGRSVDVKVRECVGGRGNPNLFGKMVWPEVQMSLSHVHGIPITTRLYYLFTKHVAVHNDKLIMTFVMSFWAFKKNVSRESIIEILDKLISIADIIEAKYHV